jgi:aspartyl-tRNA(Asn)/glutamyl-tRNA(Gln) amidotransferase subunit A
VEDFVNVFQKVDVLLTPTTITSPYPTSQQKSTVESYVDDVFTVPASLAGLPSISIPFSLSKNGLPIGLQILGALRKDHSILAPAHFLHSNNLFSRQQHQK